MMNEQIRNVSDMELEPGFIDEIAALPGGENIRKCFACGTCAAGCPVTKVDETYNCRTIIRKILLGMREEVLKSPEIWYCLLCYRCYARCPQKVNFTDIMRALRFLAVKYNYASEELLAGSNDIEKLSQTLRRDMVKDTLSGQKKIIEEIRAKVNT
jgi:heterodisulfide reductase subunit C